MEHQQIGLQRLGIQIRKETAIEQVIVASPADFLPPLLQRLYPFSQRGNKDVRSLMTKKLLEQDKGLHLMQGMLRSNSRGGIELFNLPVPMKGDDLAVLQYTGGTTGLAKKLATSPRKKRKTRLSHFVKRA